MKHKMKLSHRVCRYICIMCIITLLGVTVLIKTDSLSTPLSGVLQLKSGNWTVNHKTGCRQISLSMNVMLKHLSSGSLVGVQVPLNPEHGSLHDDCGAEAESGKIPRQKNESVNHSKAKVNFKRSLPISEHEITNFQSNLQTGLSRSAKHIRYTTVTVDEGSRLIHSHNDIPTLAQGRKDVFSQNPDIDERGKWQREQVDKYCIKHRRDKLALTIPISAMSKRNKLNLLRHLIFDDERKLIYCFIPKVGCTHLLRYLFMLQGIIPNETVTWKSISETYYVRGIHRASLLNHSLSDSQRLSKIKNYWKFMIVRNPLERLLSAFVNKLSKPLKMSKYLNEFELLQWNIMKKYRTERLKQWRKGDMNETMQVDFEAYLQWVIDTPNYRLNEHFAPIIELAQPCRVKYHFYGNFETYSSDVKAILSKLGTPQEWFVNRTSHTKGEETSNKMIPFYSTVRREVKEKLIQDISDDLEFYYTLYPEEEGNQHKIFL